MTAEQERDSARSRAGRKGESEQTARSRVRMAVTGSRMHGKPPFRRGCTIVYRMGIPWADYARREQDMKMTAQEYARRVRRTGPHSPLLADIAWAFCVGGGICLLGETLRQRYLAMGMEADLAGTLTSCTLIALSAVLTTLGWYQKLAAKAGAGSLVPITGFANAIAAPAVEFQTEGFILGVGAKIFTIAGPVIVYGLSASAVYGLIYFFTTL